MVYLALNELLAGRQVSCLLPLAFFYPPARASRSPLVPRALLSCLALSSRASRQSWRFRTLRAATGVTRSHLVRRNSCCTYDGDGEKWIRDAGSRIFEPRGRGHGKFAFVFIVPNIKVQITGICQVPPCFASALMNLLNGVTFAN